MGQLTQTTAQVQVILDDADAANVGKTSLTDSTDTTAVAVKKSGFYSLGASSSNAPSTDRAILISAVRDTAATGEIRYGQVAITESNGMWWNRDDGGALGTWYEAVSTAGTQTLTNKTLTSPVLTTPQINDTSADHQYIFAVSELVADRTVTLPLLTGNDTFVFAAHTQTLTNKTLTSPVFNTGVSGSAVLDDDNFLTASSTTLATSESIKAYVDAKVTGEDLDFAGDTGTGAVDLDSQVFTIAGTANEIETSATGQTLTIGLPNSVTITTALSVDTISEKTAAAGVTVDSLLIKDGGITAAGTSTFAGQTISDLGTVTTANIDGGSIDGTTIGASTAAAGTFTSVTADGLTIGDFSGNSVAQISAGTTGVSSLYLGDGSSGAASYAGFVEYNHTGDYLRLGASSAEVVRVSSTGIDVTGTVVSNGLTLENNAEYLSVKNSSGTSTRAFGVNSGNNLYIGGIDADIGPILFVDNGATLATLGPTGLDVNGTVTATGDFLTSTGMQVSGHPVVGYAAITGGYAARLGSTGTSTLNETQIYAGGNFVATFQRGGNVGIGLGGASPQQLLHINGGAADTAFQITNSASGSTATDGFSITVENPTPDVVLRNRESSNMRFLTANTERIRITSAGQTQVVGYDAMTLGFPAVAGGASRSGIKPTITGAGDGQLQFLVGGNNVTEATTIGAMIDASGNLLVGDSSTLTNARIESFGSANGVAGIGMRHTGATAGQWWRIYMQNDSKAIFTNASGTGVSLTYGGTSWSAVSDEALKENISDIGPVLDKVTNYRCVNYSLKATQSADADKIGFIAQDWEADFPNVVDRDENDELSMKYTETIPVLLKAIQEQQDLIESLTARIAALEGAN